MSSRVSWLVAILVILASGAGLGLLSGSDSASQSPVALPASAESARADALRAEFPGGDIAPAIIVFTRTDGGPLSPAEVAAAGPGAQVSQDGLAAVSVSPLSADLSGFALNDAVQELRTQTAERLPEGLQAEVTGGPAFGADIANSFAGANITLLAVTAAVVALLLIITYRSPVLWLVPLLVIAFADRVGSVVGTAVASGLGLNPDGSTGGITSVLVFGAGTNYALLLISRYREELGRSADHREALRVATRAAGPAILASNATVVLALLTLAFATAPSNRSLGVQAAAGLVVAAIFVLFVLPPFLGLFGKKLFWPFIPQVGDEALTDSGVWHRVASWVAGRPGWVATGALGVLVALCFGLVGTPVGLSQTEQFRVQAESVSGYDTLAEHFPSGLTDPAVVIAPTSDAAAVSAAITGVPGVVSARPAGESGNGLSQWSVVLQAEPASDEAFETVDALRSSVHSVSPEAVVGGSDAKARDSASAAQRDRMVVIPAILAVVLVVLFVLLRSALAPVVLVSVTVLSALAALGIGGWASVHLFGFPALDNGTPLFAFLFLVALGVDYTIFLVTRAREETPEFGLFWPSLLMTGDMWAGQASEFQDGHQVILVDPPGHGGSEKLSGPFTFDECAQTVVDVLDGLGVERAHFVGNSWGGMIGGTFAARHPDRIGRAVLMNCTASPAGRRQRVEYGLLLRTAKLLGGIRGPLTGQVLKAFLGPTTFRDRPDVVRFVRDAARAVDLDSSAWAVTSVVPQRPDQRALLSDVRTPVLVVAGAEDATFPVAETLEMADAIQGAATAVLDGVAHLAALENPRLVNALIKDFVFDA